MLWQVKVEFRPPEKWIYTNFNIFQFFIITRLTFFQNRKKTSNHSKYIGIILNKELFSFTSFIGLNRISNNKHL